MKDDTLIDWLIRIGIAYKEENCSVLTLITFGFLNTSDIFSIAYII